MHKKQQQQAIITMCYAEPSRREFAASTDNYFYIFFAFAINLKSSTKWISKTLNKYQENVVEQTANVRGGENAASDSGA